MNRPERDHPDMRDDAPGRIPESLIDAAIDGELDPEVQKEIGRALQYDPERRMQFHDTRDAINALRMPVEMPDLCDQVLARANRHRRFIPRKLRAGVRAGRVATAALLLVGLFGVAVAQRAYPRLTSIAATPTPVRDIERAVEVDRVNLAKAVTCEVNAIKEHVAPVAGILDLPLKRPGMNDQSFALTPITHVTSGESVRVAGGFDYSTQSSLAVVTMMRARTLQSSESNEPFEFVDALRARQLVYASWSLEHIPDSVPSSEDKTGYEVTDLP